jgi:glucuronoarabinoxylan endo-1,4-beta-xylanase
MFKAGKAILMIFVFALVFCGCLIYVSAATVTVKPEETHQTIEGFGASLAWYEGMLTNHPNKEDIYYYIFDKLGLSILRLRDTYRYQNEDNFTPEINEIVNNMYKYSDRNPKIMMSCWSPPANLKSNNSETGGTLRKDENGKFVYDAFAQYWLDSLKAYRKIGIVPYYISIENEPTWGQHEACLMTSFETADTAGYDKALEAVYWKLISLKSRPKILASEVHGIGFNTFQLYAEKFNRDFVDGYAYHLYHGGDGNKISDSFIPSLKGIADAYSDKPIFQTEYHKGDWFSTAWIVHTCLVSGNVSAYLYWDLVWEKGKGTGLVEMEDPNNTSQWTTHEGYIVTDKYYAFRQFSKYIYPGWKRVSADADSDALRVSAFISPYKDSLTVVVLNISNEDLEFSMNRVGFQVTGGGIVRTSEKEKGQYVGKYDTDASLTLPARSITTLTLNIEIANQ